MLTTLKQLLDLFSALRALALWIVQKEMEANAKAAVQKSEELHDQTAVEAALDRATLGHTTVDFPSVRIEPVKDRSKN